MRASVVIPTYNMGAELDLTLSFLAAQELEGADSFEVLVVDDGSTDTTQQVVAAHATKLRPKLLHRPRDAESCRSRARNLGLYAATGELCVFLDSGMLAEPSFLRLALARHRLAPNSVLIHETLGLFAQSLGVERRSLTPDGLRAAFASRVEHDDLRDIRQDLLASVHGDLDQLPAAWALGWSCALSVPRTRALEVRGFDEEFVAWGAEDIDFCYRLMRAGVRFESLREALCVHVPHATSDRETKTKGHVANKLKLHRRDPTLESELNVLLGGIACNLLSLRLERLATLRALPVYPAAILEFVGELATGRRLLIGCADPAVVRALRPAAVLVHSRHDVSRLAAEHPGVDVSCSFGCLTAYPDRAFDTAILTDELRIHPVALQIERLRECARIARSTCLLLGIDEDARTHRARVRASEGWGWSSEAELAAASEAAGCSLAPIVRTGSHALYRIQLADRARSSAAQLDAGVAALGISK